MYEEIILGQDATTVSLRAVTGRATVPQVFIGGRHIGGSDDLEQYFLRGECRTNGRSPVNIKKTADPGPLFLFHPSLRSGVFWPH